MTDYNEIRRKIDIKLVELRQQAHYAINKYDYHHKNDELQIIEQQKEILNQVAGTCAKFLNEMQKFNQTLNDAKQLSAELDQLLMQHSKPTTQQLPSSLKKDQNSHLHEQQQQQHETNPPELLLSSLPLKNLHPLSGIEKDKLKDIMSKKQLFPST